MKKLKRASISRTKLKRRIKDKTNPETADAIALALKNPAWNKYAKLLSQSTRKQSSLNLGEIDAKTTMGDTVLVPGRVLAVGEVTKKLRICSFGISKGAMENLKKTRSEWIHISDEIKKNPKAEGLKVLK